MAAKLLSGAEGCYRFGPFELDARSGELRKYGTRIRLQEQPLQILILLLSHPGEVVRREEMRSLLWAEHTSVEFAHGINAAVGRLRAALGDSAEKPRYVETVARRGYRFVAPVEAQPAAADTVPSAPPVEPSAAARPHVIRSLPVLAAASVMVLLTAVSVSIHVPVRMVRMNVVPPRNFTFVGSASISPDGSRLVAAVENASHKRQLWVRSLASRAERWLPDTSGASDPFWSADGKDIGFFANDEIYIVSASDGSARRIIAALAPSTGSFSVNGTLLYSQGRHMPLFRIGGDGPGMVPATRLAEGETRSHTSPHFLPDGRRFVFLAPAPVEAQSTVFLASLDSFDRRLLLTGATEIGLAPPDYLLFLRDGVLMAQRFDFDRAQPVSEPRRIFGGSGAERVTAFSASAAGIVLRQAGAAIAQRELVWRDRGGRRIAAAGEPAGYWQVSLAPDESSVAVNRQGLFGGELHLLRLGNRNWSPVALGPGDNLDGVWSPDSRSLVYQIYGRHKTRIMLRNIDEPTPKLLLDDGYSNYPDDWSPDGKWILGRRTANIVFTLAPDGRSGPTVLLKADHLMDQLHFSPDGKWVAYNSDESGRWEIYAARFPRMDGVRQLSRDGGCQPLWRKDGKELFYLDPEGKLFSVPLTAGSVSLAGAPGVLFQSGVTVSCLMSQYAVSGDGRRFLTIEPRTGEDAGMLSGEPLRVLRNWAAAGAR